MTKGGALERLRPFFFGRTKTVKTLITFPAESLLAVFRRREKRFTVEADRDGVPLRVHCNNSGSMMGLLRPGCEILVSPAPRPGRKLPYTLELVKVDGFWTGVNTLTPNRILKLAWEAALLPETAGCDTFRSEAKIGESRLDARLSGPEGALWVESKNVTLVEEDVAYFPDAPTLRGQKHLRELIRIVKSGERAACFCLIQRPDARCFAPADFIDPAFADLFWEAMDGGVEIWPYQALISPEGIALGQRLPVRRPG